VKLANKHFFPIPNARVCSEFYNNYNGAFVQNYMENSKVFIEDVIVNNNPYQGMTLIGTGITVENAKIKNNGFGLVFAADSDFTDIANEITLDGDIFITGNTFAGLDGGSGQGTVYFTGNVNSIRNEVGLFFSRSGGADYTFKVESSGSLTACDNWKADIVNLGDSTFEGSGYTCTKNFNKTVIGLVGGELPKCEPCHPGCASATGK